MSDDTSAPQDADTDDNPFTQFVTPDTKSYADASLLDRAQDTFMAHFYQHGIGASVAASQADPYTRHEALMEGLTPEEQQLARTQFAQGMIDQVRARQRPENPVGVTSAQIAQIKNELWPKANSFGTYAADVLGALAGGAATPETFLLPEVGATAAATRAAARLLPEAAARFIGGSIGTGSSMAVVNTATNPMDQIHRQKAGLTPMRGRVGEQD